MNMYDFILTNARLEEKINQTRLKLEESASSLGSMVELCKPVVDLFHKNLPDEINPLKNTDSRIPFSKAFIMARIIHLIGTVELNDALIESMENCDETELYYFHFMCETEERKKIIIKSHLDFFQKHTNNNNEKTKKTKKSTGENYGKANIN